MADIVRLGSALQQAMSKADHSGKQMYQLSLQVLRVPQAAVYPLMLQARQEAEFCTGAISPILHLCARTPGDPVPLLEARRTPACICGRLLPISAGIARWANGC